jgi:glyoxylase-like metal-dependent hydrolase (beta-lactamase superfamily II)
MAPIRQLDVVPGVHRAQDAFVNWYLIEADDGLTAVDAGLPKSWDTLHDLLRATRRSRDDVQAVVLTHGHYDHVGFAERVRRELNVPVYVHDAEAEQARHPLRFPSERNPVLYMWRPETLKIMASMVASGALWAPAVESMTPFADGDILDVPGRPRVVASPGHTYGHVSLHLEDRDTILAGDALVTLDPYTGYRGPRIVARAATADSEMAFESLDRLAATGASVVLPGHGEPWRDGVEEAARLARAAGSP